MVRKPGAAPNEYGHRAVRCVGGVRGRGVRAAFPLTPCLNLILPRVIAKTRNCVMIHTTK
jgi:hypothetical protein